MWTPKYFGREWDYDHTPPPPPPLPRKRRKCQKKRTVIVIGPYYGPPYYVFMFLFLLILSRSASSEVIREFEISEDVPVGTSIGFIGEPTPGGSSNSPPPPPPYLIVPVPGSSVDTDLTIDQSNGEILTKVQLDRETRDEYSLVAIPLTGENIRVKIVVKDVNDNAPEFPMSSMSVEFPENTPRDVKRTLAPAKDKDIGVYNTQRYTIAGGNVNNAFRLSSHRERDGVLYLDLQVNGFLDRETISSYNLLIEAFDGGNPPLKGSMTVNITITDQNDNSPVWQFARLPNGDSQYGTGDDINLNQSRYFATVAENASVGTSVLQVFAKDQDEGPNGKITYSINRRQTDKDSMFRIDPVTGVISVNRPLDYGSKEVHELVVVARDNGIQPLEATVFVSIRIIDLNANQIKIKISFFSDSKPPTVSENSEPGVFVARISITDPDSKEEYENVSVVLEGGDGNFALENRNGVVYLIVASPDLDRERKPSYNLKIIAKDHDNPNINASTSFLLQIGDENDSTPKFERDSYEAKVSEVAQPGTSVLTVRAQDDDVGNNSALIYSLDHDWFEIDSETGVISTKKHLDCETDSEPKLVVVAKDKGIPSLSSSATVTVHLIDNNDTPLFDQSFYNASVLENTAIGKCIMKVSASDPDCGINSIVTYSFQETKSMKSPSSPFQLPFTVNKDTGDICVTGLLDYESRHSYEIPVVATDTGGLTSIAIVRIHLENANDELPIFFPMRYNVTLREGHVPEGPIVSVAAIDRDSGKFGEVTYFIQAGNEKGYFQVDSKTGEIRVTRPVKGGEGVKVYQLLVSARDGAGAVAEKPAVVTVKLVDAHSQEQPPLFKQSRYSFSISEDAPVGTFVGTVGVSPGGKAVRFSISSGDPEHYFTIDSSTGVIRTASRLDHETHSSVLLNVQAVTGAEISFSHCQVDIRIEDMNEAPPQFEMQQVSIWVPENAKVGSVIYVLHARDPDSGPNGQVTYTWVKGPTDMFKLDEKVGKITLKKQLDYEVKKEYLITCAASDMGSPPLHSNNLTIRLQVQDSNDQTPQWQPNTLQFRLPPQGQIPAGTEVGRLSPANKPAGGAIKYALETMQNLFRVDPNLGIVTTTKQLDSSKLAPSKFTASSFNQALPHHKVNISINLVSNGAPGIVTPDFFQSYRDGLARYEVTVSEGHPVDTEIFTVVALDEDTGNNARISYSLADSRGNSDTFYMLPHGHDGTILLKKALDREEKDHYEIKVIASDHGSPSLTSTALISISVEDENDRKPVFERKLYQFHLRENNKAGVVVGQVKALDEDVGDNGLISYSLEPPHPDFQIDPRSGVIRAKSPLDREKKELYELLVVASDHGVPQLESDVIVQIYLKDVNDVTPLFTEPEGDTLFVRDGSPVGTELTKVEAVDGDAEDNGTVHFYIAKDNDGFKDFEIDETLGTLKTRSEVNYERKRFYTVTVIARDSGTPTRESRREFHVEVLDPTDPRGVTLYPRKKYLFKVSESARVGSEVGSIIQNEIMMEEGGSGEGRVTYKILKGNEEGKFELNRRTGQILLVEELDHETTPKYLLEVRVNRDSNSDSEETFVDIRIEVEDSNEAPQFLQDPMKISVLENHAMGVPLWNFSALDGDLGMNGIVHYWIKEQRPQEKFRINALTGSLYLQGPLDYESCSAYVVVIEAVDQAPVESERLATSVTVVVQVQDENDAPRFKLAEEGIQVNKWEPTGTILHTFRAEDKDAGDNGVVSYEMARVGSEGSQELESLQLDQWTGQLRLVKPFKREGVLRLNVTARDHGQPRPKSSSQLLTITVKDVVVESSPPPQFSSKKYEVSVVEGTPVGASVFQVTATAESLQSDVKYRVIAGNARGDFAIEEETGIVRVDKMLSSARRSEYVLTILAEDSRESVLYDTTTLTVSVTDEVSDRSPVFLNSPYLAYVRENVHKVPMTVLQVQAFDADTGQINDKITYQIKEGDRDAFRVNATTGEITVHRALDREKQAEYLLTVVAMDARTPRLSGTGLVKILISDDNDCDPQFESERYEIQVKENSEPGTSVASLIATDLDEGLNAKLSYEIVTSESEEIPFVIDSETGEIFTNGKLDREVKPAYEFRVVAKDKATILRRSSTATVVVSLGDENDSTPEFKVNPVIVSIPQWTKSGEIVCQVEAIDKDEGVNGQVTYSIDGEESSSMFRVHPQTGQISLVSSFSSESVFLVKVKASDKGSPSKVSTGLVVVKVGEERGVQSSQVSFDQDEYHETLDEHSPQGTYVGRVGATRKSSDGRRRRRSSLIYKIAAGNDDGAFEISESEGVIRVKNPEVLDRETRAGFKLVISAQAEDDENGVAVTTFSVTLGDINDSTPKFSQGSYFASVWEGRKKGTFVAQVSATDSDLGQNATVTYHIVDGNHDNAFFIDSPFSGVVKTNIVLDREITDEYKLTIIATDEGTPQMTGTCTLQVNVIDIQDQSPVFPPPPVIKVRESTPVGSVITTVQANDVDTNPSLVYSFVNEEKYPMFLIGKYSGRVTLARPLDYETEKEHKVEIQVSDSASHKARTTLIVSVEDDNDNAPVLSQDLYRISVPDDTRPGTKVGEVKAEDKDEGKNGKIKYFLERPNGSKGSNNRGHPFLRIEEETGIVYTNGTMSLKDKEDHSNFLLIVVAQDQGEEVKRESRATLWVEMEPMGSNLLRFFSARQNVHLSRDVKLGSVVTQVKADCLSKSACKDLHLHYNITSGDAQEHFTIGTHTGQILLAKPLSSKILRSGETKLQVSVECMNKAKCMTASGATTEVVIAIGDANSEVLRFPRDLYRVELEEDTRSGMALIDLRSEIEPYSNRSTVHFSISSGNDQGLFEMGPSNGQLVLRRALRMESERVRLVIRAEDVESPSSSKQWALTTIELELRKGADERPCTFPFPSYLESVGENEPVGTPVFTVRALGGDVGGSHLNYSISGGDGKQKFRIHRSSGVVLTNSVFDYESKQSYTLRVEAGRLGGRSCSAEVTIEIESRDEFTPQFSRDSYRFTVPINAPKGFTLGRVEATDADQGRDGIVRYYFESPRGGGNKIPVGVNRTNGYITVKEQLEDRNLTLVVRASSGRPESKMTTAHVEIIVGGPSEELEALYGASSVAEWVVGLLVTLLLLLFLCCTVFFVILMRNKRQNKTEKHAQVFESSSNFGTLELGYGAQSTMVLNSGGSSGAAGSGPGPYAAAGGGGGRCTASEMGDHPSDVASSGRGSAEYGEEAEDEEIRMINEASMLNINAQQQKYLQGIDNTTNSASPGSAKNTQEYLARLGIRPKIPNQDNMSHHVYGDVEGGGGGGSGPQHQHSPPGSADPVDISNLIYAQIADDVTDGDMYSTPTGSSAAGAGGAHHLQQIMNQSLSSIVHNEDYLLDWGPQYQPLAHVFSEIAGFPDDESASGGGVPAAPSSSRGGRRGEGPSSNSDAESCSRGSRSESDAVSYGRQGGSRLRREAGGGVRGHAPPSTTSSVHHSILPRSPISHDNDSSFASGLIEPSFSPALSPLANR